MGLWCMRSTYMMAGSEPSQARRRPVRRCGYQQMTMPSDGGLMNESPTHAIAALIRAHQTTKGVGRPPIVQGSIATLPIRLAGSAVLALACCGGAEPGESDAG